MRSDRRTLERRLVALWKAAHRFARDRHRTLADWTWGVRAMAVLASLTPRIRGRTTC